MAREVTRLVATTALDGARENALLQVPQGAEAEQSVGILVSLARMAYGTLVVRARSTWKQQVAALYPIMAIHPLESGEATRR